MKTTVLQRPSLELNWLMRHEKWLPLPAVVHIDDDDLGGCYFQPTDQSVLLKDKWVDASKGIICVTDNHYESGAANVLAHEFRHHWQSHIGMEGKPTKWKLREEEEYEYTIVRYFHDPREIDALLFERTMYPTECTDIWIEWIAKEAENKCQRKRLKYVLSAEPERLILPSIQVTDYSDYAR